MMSLTVYVRHLTGEGRTCELPLDATGADLLKDCGCCSVGIPIDLEQSLADQGFCNEITVTERKNCRIYKSTSKSGTINYIVINEDVNKYLCFYKWAWIYQNDWSASKISQFTETEKDFELHNVYYPWVDMECRAYYKIDSSGDLLRAYMDSLDVDRFNEIPDIPEDINPWIFTQEHKRMFPILNLPH